MLSVERSAQPRRRRGPSRRVETAHPRPDLIAVLSLTTLVVLGLANLRALGARSLEYHQIITVLAGVAIFLALRRLPSSSLRWFGWTCYGLSVVLLVAVIGAGDAGFGARRWLTVGSFTVQPSEFAKVGLLLVLAHVLGTDRPWYRRMALALIVAAAPIALVVIEPDLSTATVLAAMTLAMLVLGRIPLKVIALLVGAVVLVAPFAEHLLQPYQVERLHAYLSGSGSSAGAGWTILQAHIALAWGGISGTAGGGMNLILAQYLPARETDLAFASLVEQWGIRAGALAVLAAAALVWRAAAVSRQARTRGAALSAAGFAVLLGVEVAVSVAANLGLIPTAGVPFPLLSYGGTAAAVHIARAGLVLGVRTEAERHRLWVAPKWRRVHPRLVRVAAFCVSVGLVAMTGFGWHLQKSRGDELRSAGLFQMTRCTPIPAPRGVITDRHGVPLATNLPMYRVSAVPHLVEQSSLPELAALVARPLSIVRQLVSTTDNGFVVPLATLPPQAAARVRAADLAGVLVESDPRRFYPYGALLGAVLGWSGIASAEDMQRWPDVGLGEIVGRAGLEEMYDPILRGTPGEQCVYVDPAGHPVRLASRTPPVPGSPLRTTLDLGLQQRFTAALGAAMSTGADTSGGVVLDPRTGQVLAMASLPGYDDNVYGPPVDSAALARLNDAAGHPQLQHATQVTAPPGSTFKLVVAAANAVRPAIPPDLVITTGGSWTLGGHTFHNWSALPPQDLTQAITWSNDVYFYQLAWALGPARIIAAARQLGVGQPTGIDLPGESSGYLGTPTTVKKDIGADWYPGSTVLLGIGQGYITVTPLLDALWTAGVATGAMVTPHLGLAYGSGRGTWTQLPWPAPRELPFAHALGTVRAGMRGVVTSGTAQLLSTLPAPAGGKTGTAEDPTAPASGEDSWLSAVAPMNAPAVTATAMVHGGTAHARASEPVRVALDWFLRHRAAIMSTG